MVKDFWEQETTLYKIRLWFTLIVFWIFFLVWCWDFFLRSPLLVILQLIYQKSLEKSKRMLNQARKEEEGSNNLLIARHDGFMSQRTS